MPTALNTTAAEVIANTLRVSTDAQSPALSPAARKALESFGWDDTLNVSAYLAAVPYPERRPRLAAVRELVAAGLARHVDRTVFLLLTDAGLRALFPGKAGV